jgi:hypothetical protein
MVEVAFEQYDTGGTDVAQQLPVRRVERGSRPQTNDEVLTHARKFSIGHRSPPPVRAVHPLRNGLAMQQPRFH